MVSLLIVIFTVVLFNQFIAVVIIVCACFGQTRGSASPYILVKQVSRWVTLAGSCIVWSMASSQMGPSLMLEAHWLTPLLALSSVKLVLGSMFLVQCLLIWSRPLLVRLNSIRAFYLYSYSRLLLLYIECSFIFLSLLFEMQMRSVMDTIDSCTTLSSSSVARRMLPIIMLVVTIPLAKRS